MSNENLEDDHPVLSDEDQARVDHFISTGVNATEKKTFQTHPTHSFIDCRGYRIQLIESDIGTHGGGLLSFSVLI